MKRKTSYQKRNKWKTSLWLEALDISVGKLLIPKVEGKVLPNRLRPGLSVRVMIKESVYASHECF